MNDSILIHLKTIVERAVRPLPIITRRKRQFREELLAHLTAVFDDEFTRLGDESAALEKTRQRFGDPRAITAELRHSLTRRDGWAAFWEALFARIDFRPGDSQRQMLVKTVGLTLATFVATELALLLPGLVFRAKMPSLEDSLFMSAVVSIFSGVFTYVFFAGCDHLRRTLFGDGSRAAPLTWRRAMPTIVGSLAFFPAFAFLIYWILVGDLAASWRNFRIACCFAWLAPIMFLGAARKMAQEVSYQREWASLDVDDLQIEALSR